MVDGDAVIDGVTLRELDGVTVRELDSDVVDVALNERDAVTDELGVLEIDGALVLDGVELGTADGVELGTADGVELGAAVAVTDTDADAVK